MFAELHLDNRLLRGLDALDFTEPTEVQQATIPPAMDGKDLLVTAATGSGKTAAFLLPILQHLLENKAPNSGTRALILAPTRELAQQILKDIEALARFTFLSADMVCGGETFKPQAARLRKNPEIIVGTPGRLIEHLDKQTLDFDDVECLVLDEADRMLDMGFQEDVMRIVQSAPSSRQTMLFSATLSHDGMQNVIAHALNEPTSLQLHSHREAKASIKQQIITANDNALKDKQLVWLATNEQFDKAIVFVNTKTAADRLNGYLRHHDVRAGLIHGDLTQEQRKHVMGLMRQGKINVLVATDVAARGIDVKGIDLVINYDMARSGDDHTHRVGRTGRAGNTGLAISLIEPSEWNLMSSIERYLKTRFEKRVIKGMEGSYQGPKKLKSSGKAAGPKRKKSAKKPASKVKRSKDKKPAAPKGPVDHGFAPLKRKR
ncbi:DEAD/DEAH box helicase [Neptunomonas marina]|uniref:DEAD/DEAH box helicase n=1 Tax=Neptunomonas marina TaxID=1815562 RepID=A0A437Q6B4_9GAMM|nr:DEAD/DEAH box helicase [Neptunomonas marina]RVU30027.1 DEAD/DEAH box helicase [Neptunomonas marina]